MIESPATRECKSPNPSPDMVFLRRFFLLLIEEVFSTSDNYGNAREELKCFTAGEGLDVTLDQIPDPAETHQYKPSVNLGMGDLQFEKSVVNYHASNTEDFSGMNFVTPAAVPLVIRHIMPSSDGAYQISQISLDAVFGLKEWIKQTLGLRGLTVSSLARPKKLSNHPETWYSVDLSILLEFEYKMRSSVQGHRIKKILTDTFLRNSSVDS